MTTFMEGAKKRKAGKREEPLVVIKGGIMWNEMKERNPLYDSEAGTPIQCLGMFQAF